MSATYATYTAQTVSRPAPTRERAGMILHACLPAVLILYAAIPLAVAHKARA
jgi:hypothetical protein